jgi:hypothetical protein
VWIATRTGIERRVIFHAFDSCALRMEAPNLKPAIIAVDLSGRNRWESEKLQSLFGYGRQHMRLG